MVKITRRNFLKAGLTAGLGVAGYKHVPGVLASRNSDGRPNIVFVTIDTTRYDRMGFNGYGRNTTPNLDRYAEKGVIFHKNYAQAPITPFSTSSFLTSQYPTDLNFNDPWAIIPSNILTMAEIFRNIGYATYGGTSTELLDTSHGFGRGFDFFSSPKDTENVFGIIRTGEQTVNALISDLEKNSQRDKPHFIWFHSYDPHTPYWPHPGFTDHFKTKGDFNDNDLKTWGSLVGDAKKLDLAYSLDYNGNIGGSLLTEKEVIDANDQYDGQILYADHQINRFLEYLSKKGLFDVQRDLLVVNADHGEYMGEHGYCSSHLGAYHGVKHTPLLFSGAGFPNGKEVHDLTENVDILPTMVEIVDVNSTLENNSSIWRGHNLIDIIGGVKLGSRKFVFTDLVDYSGFSLSADDFSITSRRVNPNQLSRNPKIVPGYFPQGSIEYSVLNAEKGVTLSWPGEDFTKHENVFTKVSVYRLLNDSNRFLLFDAEVPYTGNNFKFMHVSVFGEMEWNGTSIDMLGWKVQVVSKKDNEGEVLFDSDKHGTLEFRLEPTHNLRQFFDLRDDPNEEINLWSNSDYAQKISELDGEIDLILGKKLNASKPSSEVSDEDRATLEALGYL